MLNIWCPFRLIAHFTWCERVVVGFSSEHRNYFEPATNSNAWNCAIVLSTVRIRQQVTQLRRNRKIKIIYNLGIQLGIVWSGEAYFFVVSICCMLSILIIPVSVFFIWRSMIPLLFSSHHHRMCLVSMSFGHFWAWPIHIFFLVEHSR